MLDCGTLGWFLRTTVGSPEPRKEKFRRVAPGYADLLLSHRQMNTKGLNRS